MQQAGNCLFCDGKKDIACEGCAVVCCKYCHFGGLCGLCTRVKQFWLLLWATGEWAVKRTQELEEEDYTTQPMPAIV